MSDPVRFLGTFGHALAVMALYPEGHPERETALDAAHRDLDDLATSGTHPSFTFLEDEVVYRGEPLKDSKAWSWGPRLVAAGVQRLEFDRPVSRGEFDDFLQEILARLSLSAIDTTDRRQMHTPAIRFGTVGLQGEAAVDEEPTAVATLDFTLDEEAETLRWLQQESRLRGSIPLLEAEAVVRSLSVAMHGDQRMVLPLVRLKEFDQYTTTHSLNVAVLSMGLGEAIECADREVRHLGIAGLLHDIGKTRIPVEVLTKPGKLTEEERQLMNRHPADGARIIMQSDEELELAATVAYEHHIMLNGTGYPAVHYRRACTVASRLVHVCDVYDALRTRRPYREAWSEGATLAYIRERAGTEFDPDLVGSFLGMLQKREVRAGELRVQN